MLINLFSVVYKKTVNSIKFDDLLGKVLEQELVPDTVVVLEQETAVELAEERECS